MSQVRIGTSGWSYRHWEGVFYPPRLLPRRWLEHYAQEFDTVEVNATFYRLLPENTFTGWRSRVPPAFLFSLKASRSITHRKRLEECQPELDALLSRARLLSDQLGPLLFQLPPRWPVEVERLRSFLSLLPPDCRVAFELRDPSWLCEPVYEALRARGAALVRVSAPDFPDADVATADFSYLRMHGGELTYASRYSDASLAPWADAIDRWVAEGRDVFVYFNNDYRGHAVEDARALRRLVAQRCSA